MILRAYRAMFAKRASQRTGIAGRARLGPDDALSAVTAGPAVDQVIPSPGDEVLPAAGGGGPQHPLPGPRNRFEFVPGDGRLIEALSPDTNCAVARFVLIARPEESDTVRWCFEVS